MPNLKIATWNVNSLRVRLPHVLTWLDAVKPDVLALQEIKLVDAEFPYSAIEKAGYSAIVSGQKTYNGVAILSRHALTDNIVDIPELADPQRRVLGVKLNDISILNLYIPNGERVGSEKYQYKLNWLQHLDRYLKQQLTIHHKYIVLGDFNIAPQEIDVHDPAMWNGHVLFSPLERQAFLEMLEVGFTDCFRYLHPVAKEYSWWDYRMYAFKRNLGLRIDHILASKAMMSACKACYIDKTPRAWERPSDHAPVVAEFQF